MAGGNCEVRSGDSLACDVMLLGELAVGLLRRCSAFCTFFFPRLCCRSVGQVDGHWLNVTRCSVPNLLVASELVGFCRVACFASPTR